MKGKIMKRFCWILILAATAASTCSPLCAEPVATAIPLAYDDTKIYIGLDIWHETLSPPTSFDVSSPAKLTDPADIVLSQYYAYAKTNDTESIKDVFSTLDGSRDSLIRKLMLTPAMFSNYGTLQNVRIDSKNYWGGYRFVDVVLSGGAGTLKWREDVLCDGDDCKMSIAFDNSTEKEQWMETVLLWTDAFLSSTYDQNDLDAKMAVLHAEDRKTSVYPDILPSGSSTSPVTFYVDLEQLPENTFDINPKIEIDDPPPTPPDEVQAVLDMLKAAAAASKDTIETALAPHFTSMPGGGFIRMTEMVAGSDGSSVSLTSKAFPWTIFYERIEPWTTLRILGIARFGDISYLFVEPQTVKSESEIDKDTIQLFTVLYNQDENEYKLLTDTDQGVPWYAFKASFIMALVYEQYQ